jgi:enoyl-CoA hydratase/carnithine racemase
MSIDAVTGSDIVLFEELPFLHQPQFRLGKVVLNRPLQKNALNEEMVSALFNRLSIWQQDRTIIAIWLEGAGHSFCAGGARACQHLF